MGELRELADGGVPIKDRWRFGDATETPKRKAPGRARGFPLQPPDKIGEGNLRWSAAASQFSNALRPTNLAGCGIRATLRIDAPGSQQNNQNREPGHAGAIAVVRVGQRAAYEGVG